MKNVALVGPALTRQKLHQFCLELVKRVKAQVGAYSAEPIPEKINLIPLYIVGARVWGEA